MGEGSYVTLILKNTFFLLSYPPLKNNPSLKEVEVLMEMNVDF